MRWYQLAAAKGDEESKKALKRLGAPVPETVKKETQQAKRPVNASASGNDFNALLERANRGDVEAQFEVGRRYGEGDGVQQDYRQAREWYEKAANRGYARAQNNLGVLYHDGKGVPQDYRKAREWYEKAAAQNYGYAFNNLGWIYQLGQGVNVDYKKALEYYTKGAEIGMARSMNQLGVLYRDGKGVPQDYRMAREWCEKSAAKNYAPAFHNLGDFYHDEKGVPQDYRRAFEYYTRGAELGNTASMTDLGWMYEHGEYVNVDYKEAFRWYTKAADKGRAAAMYHLGRMYEEGIGTNKDLRKAMDYYRQAAAKDHKKAKEALARLESPQKPSAPAVAKTTPKTPKPAQHVPAITPTTPPSNNPTVQQNDTGSYFANRESRNKPRLTVLEFDDTTGNEKAAKAIRRMMITELNEAEIFNLVTREKFEEDIGREINYGQSGLIDPSTAPAPGKVKGLQYTMRGTVTNYYYEEKGSGVVMPILGIATQSKTAYIVLDIEIFDNETSEIVYTASRIGQAKSVSKGAGITDRNFFIGGYSKKTSGTFHAAARDAVKNHVDKLKTSIN